ncbi:acetyl-CoA synthetase-like protein [Tilletiaria anomala UBC 951]|uniref:Acetyl-CoA synthetase-like protein n=1 Tax=Tilletiaria anomala (strain ATCC 24038 / CBS 436.72 / UBC 951) TaxID=1037660 RepID=A0A066VNB7_TILAU|nr:acetyl-CoA synthetase-like protein [Tilletiaria anomala UBC 951]KDN40254.1 acetyl-CoA synthetase-like protein [Tilletiaria anomala UBC 951]
MTSLTYVPPDQWPKDKQALEVPSSARPGYTPIYRNLMVPELNIQLTAYDTFSRACSRSPNNDFVGCRPWDWAKGDYADYFEFITFIQVEERRTALGSALSQLAKDGKLGNDIPPMDWCVAFWTNNKPEFQIVHQACNAYSRRLVCIYDTYEAENAAYILKHSESRIVFTTSAHFHQVLSKVGELPHLKLIVLLDQAPPAPMKGQSDKLPPSQIHMNQLAASWAREKGVRLIKWDELLDLGRRNLHAHTPPTSTSAIAMYCYTSGTTGKPKAAFVSHGQLAMAAEGTKVLLPPVKAAMIGYLPVAHVFECLLEAGVITRGGRIGYSTGDPLRLVEDCQLLKPDYFPAVPRVLNRIAAQIQEQMNGDSFKAKLLRRAVESKLAYHDIDGSVTHAFWDRLIFGKVKAILGGNVQLMICGSAPIRPEVLKLLRIAFCADVREGYGQTENLGYCTVNIGFRKEVGSVGAPQVGVELRLKDCPELNYFSSDKPRPRGELLVRGPNVFSGYFKDEAKTRETIDEEGWLHSGDVASVDEMGRFYIIDRVKNLVKLSQGEYVAIEKVEQTYNGRDHLAQIMVYGESLQDYLIAICIPEPEPFARFASNVLGRAVSPSDVPSLCADEKLREAVLLDLVRLGKERGLNGVEMLRGVHLSPELMSVENGLLTPTFKTKRPEASKFYSNAIKQLYAKGPVDINSAHI